MLRPLVAGLGFRIAALPVDIIALVKQTVTLEGRSCAELTVLATLARKADAPALIEAARVLDCVIVGLSETELARTSAAPHSPVMKAIGIGSVAEAAAMHFGPMLGARQASAMVTCAISERVWG